MRMPPEISRGDFAEKEMIGKTFELDTATARSVEMKALRTFGGFGNESVQFLPKLIAEPLVHFIVTP